MTATAQQMHSQHTDSPRDSGATLLTQALQAVFRGRALELLDRFLDTADDRLFEYSERAGAAQSTYLQLMRRLRTQRGEVRARFASALDTRLEPGWRPHALAAAEAPGGEPGLRLMDDRTVEHRLAVQTTSQRLEGSCGSALYDFKQRLEAARRAPGLRLLDVQFAPAVLCFALAESVAVVEVEAEQLLVLLKFFEQIGRSTLEGVYAELAMQLGACGIEGAPVAPMVNPTPAAAAESASLAIHALAANTAALAALLRLPAAAAPAQLALDRQLAEATRVVQGQAAPAWAGTVALRAAAGAWLFDDILNDANIPPSLRGGLEGLRAPFVRAALLEDKFMHDAAHPLRRLAQDVATLAATARLAPPRAVSGVRDFIAEMGFTLERTLPQRDLRAAPAVDDPALQSFSEAVRAAGGERRGLLVRQAREVATQTVGEAVDRHLPGVAVPESLALALEKVFGPLLGLVLLRAGRSSRAFGQAQALLDEFLGAAAQGPITGTDLVARVARAAAAAGLSAGYQAGLTPLLEEALRAAPLLAPGAIGAAAAPAHDFWNPTPGLEVAEVSADEIAACASALFQPGGWFRLRGADGVAQWMQVERCDAAQGQVAFTAPCGGAAAVQPLQRLLFEVLAGNCEHIGGGPHSDRLLAGLARKLGMNAAA